jgi:hypothetical protein
MMHCHPLLLAENELVLGGVPWQVVLQNEALKNCCFEKVMSVAKLFAACSSDNPYLDSSLVVQFHVNAVPVKPAVRADMPEHWQRALSQSEAGISSFRPLAMVDCDPAQNTGLVALLKHVAAIARRNPQRPFPWVIDQNLYLRLMKVHDVNMCATLTKFTHPCYSGLDTRVCLNLVKVC